MSSNANGWEWRLCRHNYLRATDAKDDGCLVKLDIGHGEKAHESYAEINPLAKGLVVMTMFSFIKNWIFHIHDSSILVSHWPRYKAQ
jgi:hypothetical protein